MSDPAFDDGSKPILPKSVLNDRNNSDGASSAKKKKIIGGVVVGAAVLALILGLTLRKKSTDDDSGGDDGGGSNPDTPINPYVLIDELNTQTQIYSGVLQYKPGALQKLGQNLKLGNSENTVTLLNPTKIIPNGENNKVMEQISFEIGQSDFKTSYLWLSDSKNARYSIPKSLSPKPQYQQIFRTDMCGLSIETDPFTFTFTDSASNDDVLVTSKNAHFYMSDKYLQLDLTLPSQRIFGLGERQHEFSIKEGTWTMWANSDVPSYDTGNGGKSGKGVHPFALVQTKNPGVYFGIFFRNSNAQSPIVQYNEDGKSVLSFISTGGNIEMYFFWKGTAKQIIQQYQNFIGKPNLPPFWSLGWHAGSKSYATLQDLQTMIKGYSDEGMPLEAIWLNNNIYQAGANFKIDTTNYPALSAFRTTLDATNQKLVLTVNTGLDATKLDDHYIVEGQAGKAFIKSTENPEGDYQGALVTDVNGSKNLFLDLFQPSAANLWTEAMGDLYTATKFDGVSLVGNEPFSMCNGEYTKDGKCLPEKNETSAAQSPRQLSEAFLQALKDDPELWYQSYSDQSVMSTYNLPFIPYNGSINLDNQTISLNATHSSGDTEYDVHNLMGHMQSAATRAVLKSDSFPTKSQRQFVVSAGTFSGSGANTGHSTGPNNRDWGDLKNATASVMRMNMFGVPFSGPDVCGTYGELNEELCARWIQTSAFYPFARQYSEDGSTEPFSMEDPGNKAMAKASLQERLRYSRQLYTCMFEAKDSGNTCFDPLFFHFPTDDKAFVDTEQNFVFANSLLVTPVVESKVTEVSTYLPAGSWVNMKDFTVTTSKGEVTKVPVQPDVAITHLMPGKIVTKQMGDFNTTADLKDNKFTLVANRDTNGQAQGSLYVDDGITEDQPYDYMQFQLSANSFKRWISGTSGNDKKLDALIITNAKDLADVDFACARANDDYSMTSLTATPDATEGAETLTIKTSDGSPIDLGTLKDIHWGVSSKDLNLCDIASQYYKVSGDPIDLSGPTATATLTSQTTKDILPDLKLTLTLLKTNVVNIHWTYADTSKGAPFEVPTSIVDPKRDEVSDQPLSSVVDVTNPDGEGPISISVKNTGDTPVEVFKLNGMVLSDYFNFIDSTAVAKKGSKGVMGLFERVASDLFLPDGVFSLWTLDTANPVETAKPPGNNLYGTHPFYMGQAQDDTWFGVFTNLAAAQDWWLKTDESGATRNVGINSYAAGGAGDIFVMTGAGPNEVTKQYHTIVGTPVVIPQWILGWNQCKWGYNNTDALKAVVEGYQTAGIPLDTQWSDIDWMNNYQDFVFDPVNFKDLPDFVKDLHENKNMHYIPIIDAGLAKRTEGYEPYADGKDQDIFIKVKSGEIFTGQVWPDDAAFPDFFNDKTAPWWQKWLSDMQSKVAFDGLWLDMNEASNFCTGVCYQSQMSDSPVKYQLPYVPTGRDLEMKSITLDGIHDGNVKELDAHSLFGTMEVKATHEWFQKNNKRTAIIERSSYAGMGKFGSRWLGDNFSSQEYMGYSVTGIMGHNIMGIPLAGSDICGFIGNTTAELCARWHILGAFYPFSRNHNSWDTISQEPYQPMFQETYTSTTSYETIMKKAIFTKYDMIRYYYSELSFLSQEGGAFYKPLFFEFPGEAGAYENQELNIMLGDALKLSINSNKLDQNTTDFYFPEGLWCAVYNQGDYDLCITSPAGGQTLSLRSLAYDFYLHLRAGYMFPHQNATDALLELEVKTSHGLKAKPIELHILPLCDAQQSCSATGRYLNDDGESLDVTGKQNIYTFAYAQAAAGSDITLTVTKGDNPTQVNANDVLGNLQIYNAKAMGLDQKAYTVTATKGETTIQLGTTETVDPSTDRLVWNEVKDNDPANLWEIDTITLTPAA